jgi:hypothetical protein
MNIDKGRGFLGLLGGSEQPSLCAGRGDVLPIVR